ncbi:helix-turn-helix domain-containing protein [Gluconobacter japonicus]|uniref:helix-turn-helix domain-containing protein n=1 Tax=Gluconobacter japonicus TaxID=376620 RepID=UPI0003D33758|nr:AraC family transcriptional regulator [Gluconobacter japonicus]MBS1051157.1 helix-turn-helix transcriptional regulator [Gluconobacter japonicus]GAD09019.1 arac-type DNA-binding domain-containing protein [Gluconobacter frateurii NBRC 103465]
MGVPRLPSRRAASLALEQLLPGKKIAQSEGDVWNDVDVQIFTRPVQEDEILVPAVAEPLLVWVIRGEANIEERELTGPWEQSKARAGTFYLTQTDTPYLMRWQGKGNTCFEVLHLYLGLELVDRAAKSLNLTSSRIRMRDVSGGEDAFISGILSGLIAEMQSSVITNSLFVNGLLESLTVHLLRQYADARAKIKLRSTLLPTWKLRRVLDHMEAHLAEPFDLDCLAALCGMSRFHFSRSFRTTTGQTPSGWFIQHRVQKASEMLRKTNLSIIEIALGIGYDSPSHFAQVFRRVTGVSPRHYRKL